ncbi:ATP-binding protein [Methanolobus sp.]|jgi:PAS domain S-box-containing protein|uniref:ATP-binding protein n=1 Tax=Methanolobus sp. TaxID=1874737 RepID=UPI0025DF7D45|nr:ATP-binding protein [Methanolobus sp.]
MDMEKKGILLHGSTFIAITLLMLFSGSIIFSSSFTNLEEQYAIHNTNMLTDTIHNDISSLSSSALYLTLYAQLDNIDLNSRVGYDQILRNETLLKNHDIDHLLIYAPSNELLFINAGVSEGGNDSSSFDELEAYIASHPEILSKCQKAGSLSGLIFLPDRAMVVAMNSLASGNESEQDISVIVVSRMLDLKGTGTMLEGSRFSVLLENVNTPDVSDSPVTGQFAGNVFLSSFDNGDPAGSVQLYDIMGDPGKLLKVSTIGQNSTEMLRMMFRLAFALLILGAVGFITHITITNKITYSRFKHLIDEIRHLQKSGNLSSRIMVDGNDEVNWIADNVNGMLVSLQEKEGKYHSLFEQSNDAIIVFDSDGLILDANSRTSELLGYEKSMLFELYVSSLSPVGYSPTAVDIFEETLHKGSVKSEIKIKLFDDRVIDADISSSVINKEEGTVQAIVRDITEKKRSEETLLYAKMEAEAANRTKSEFLANMSHELRTPLNSVIGFSDMLLLETFGKLNEKQKRHVRNVSNSGKHLLTLINDILDLSKVEAGKMELCVEDIRTASLLSEAVRITSPLASKKEIILISNIDPQLVSIKADRKKLNQVLLNLLSNAIKFTPENGKVTIEVELDVENIRFAVKDTGIGISKNDQEFLFHEFTQIDSAQNRKYEGTGLGLALVKKFVEMHGGKVWVESELGKGSSFYFEIPVNDK